MDQDLNIFST